MADKNTGPKPSSGKSGGGMTAENTSLHILRKMGQTPKFEVSGKKTPA